MSGVRQAVGDYGERVAVGRLIEAGMQVLDRNWRCAMGELDVVALDGGTVVFCEVRTRRGDVCGTPAESVTAAKIRRVRMLAALWLAAHDGVRGEVRFDLVSVWPQLTGAAVVEHLRGAF
jgi:putative endonuclease